MPSDDAKPAKKINGFEDDADDDETCIGVMLENRKKKISEKSGPKSSFKTAKVKKELVQSTDSDKVVKVKKEIRVKKEVKDEYDDDDDDDDDSKPILKRASVTKPNMKRQVKDEDEDVDVKPILKRASKTKPDLKKTKSSYDLPGQKRVPPEERDPSRVFYESLLEQVPNSEMAQIWMMESGLLSKELATKVFQMKQNKKGQKTTLSSTTKSVKKTMSSTSKTTTLTSPASSNKTKSPGSKITENPTKKRKVKDESSDVESDDDFIINQRQAKKKRST